MINVTKTYMPDIRTYNRFLERAYSSGWITNAGPLVQELEDKLRSRSGVRHLILVSNGSLALQVAYRALALSGEVITTPFSFVATTSTLVWEGLKPVFADIDPHSLNLDPDNVARCINDQTSAILPVHVYGNPCAVDAFGALAKRHGLKLVYDAAHAFGVEVNGKGVLCQGDISTISFHATKLFHTVEGGALTTDSDEIAERIRLLINFGITGPTRIDALGINAKMNEFQAAMGLAVLEDMDRIIEQRQDIYTRYERGLNGAVMMPALHDGATRNHAYLPLVFRSSDERASVESALKAQQIIPRRYFYPSLNTLPYLEGANACPISEDIVERILCLPIYPGLRDEIPVEDIVELVKQGIRMASTCQTR